MLGKVKLALRISTDAFDEEIDDLIAAAKVDLSIAGITNTSTDDPLIRRAIITYCRLNFGAPEEYSKLKTAYNEQKSQLSMASGYTRWIEAT